MKRSVYITGISCAILMLFGCISKVMHWPGAGPMIIVSVCLFCFWFLPMGIKNNYDLLPIKKMKTLHIVTFIVFSICMMGVLFKVMHWPGASIFLLLGLLLPFVVFLPVYLYNTREEEKTGNKNFLALTLGLTFLAVFGALLAVSISKQTLYQAVVSTSVNDSETKLFTSPSSNTEINKAASELFNYTEELKCMVLTAIDENMCDGNKTNSNYDANKISNLDNRQIVQNIFFSKEGNPRVNVLKEKISIFRKTVLSSKSISPELGELTKFLFNTSDEDLSGAYPNGMPWESRALANSTAIFTLDFLSKLQNNVRLVEGEALK
ncbi:MAG TPA: hypothetical protein VN026_04930 [Bacteroidia bacterium]|jgi:hypothetical protein|nr:hypothetical protein [Bacteroidia bacterium]